MTGRGKVAFGPCIKPTKTRKDGNRKPKPYVLIIHLYWGWSVIGFPEHLRLSAWVSVGISVDGCEWLVSSANKGLLRPDSEAWSGGCWVSRGLWMSRPCHSMTVSWDVSLVAGCLASRNMVTPFGCLHRLYFGNKMLVQLNLAAVFWPGVNSHINIYLSFSPSYFW
jgi:hypothetical protein